MIYILFIEVVCILLVNLLDVLSKPINNAYY